MKSFKEHVSAVAKQHLERGLYNKLDAAPTEEVIAVQQEITNAKGCSCGGLIGDGKAYIEVVYDHPYMLPAELTELGKWKMHLRRET